MTDQRLETWNGPYADVYHRLYELWPMRQMLDRVIEAAGITSASRVLDVGCGTGFLLRRLQETRLAPAVTGLDFSPKMLAQAGAEPYDGQTAFQQVDFDTPVQDWKVEGSFDVLVLVNSLYIAQDPRRLIQELGALGAEDATLVVSTPCSRPNPRAVLDAHLNWFAGEGGDRQAEESRILDDPEFRVIMAQNRDRVLGQPTYHYLSQRQTWALFYRSGWRVSPVRTTYADQNWLARAERDPNDRTFRTAAVAGRD